MEDNFDQFFEEDYPKKHPEKETSVEDNVPGNEDEVCADNETVTPNNVRVGDNDDTPVSEEPPLYHETDYSYAEPGDVTDSAYSDQFTDDNAFADVPEEEEPAPREVPKKKKKRPLIRRMRRTLRRVAKIPTKTLIIFGGGIAVLLAAIIVMTLVLSKGCTAKKSVTGDATVTSAPASSEATPTLPPLSTEGSSAVTPAEATPHPLEGLGTKGKNGWYLKQNDDYPIVAVIQERLHELGYMDIPVIDGKEGYTTKYGPSTKAAVRAFQYVNSIDVDGMLGQSSYDLLMSDAVLSLRFNNSYPDSVFGTYITKLQTRLISLHYLTGEATGKFETRTREALKQFQAKNGLTADGIAGPMTLSVLYSTDALDATSPITVTPVPVVKEDAQTAGTEEDVTKEPADAN